MNTRLRGTHAVALLALLTLAPLGCALLESRSLPTRFYVLGGTAAPPAAAAMGVATGRKIGLAPVELPAYLRGRPMVTRTAANEVRFSDLDRWAEPLDQGISRVLGAALARGTAVGLVRLDSRGDPAMDLQAAVRVAAFEGVRGADGLGSIRVELGWELRRRGGDADGIARGAFVAGPVPWDGKDYGQLAGRLSEALAAAGKMMAADLERVAGAGDGPIPPPGGKRDAASGGKRL